ncbi:MAG: hypothetical protein Q4F69_06770 [Bacteroidia bacterium]|nr:hypothetical protein [Bacteroidia bacterium]
MKRLIIVLSSMALVFGMAQCRKNLEQMNPATPEGTEEVSLTAGYDDNGKTDITLDGMVTWTIGDKLYAVGEKDGFLGELTLEPQGYNTPSNKAVFKGNLNVRTETQDLHFYYVGTEKSVSSETYMFDISQQNGTLENIVKNMHIAHGVKNDVPAGETKLGSVSMHNMMAIAKFDISAYTAPMKCSGTNVLTGGTLNLKTGKWTSTKASEFTLKGKNLNFRDYYMVLMPSEAEQQFTFKQNDSDEHPVVKPRVIEAGKLYTGGSSKDGAVAIPVKTIPVGSMPGVFTVSGSGEKVRFSKGNLYASVGANDTIWRFEENQYDYRTFDKKSGSVINNMAVNCPAGDCGLLAWSSNKHGATYGKKDWGMNYSGTATDYFGEFLEWGIKPIENGGNQPNQWSTLSADQLKYILNSRTGDVRYVRACWKTYDTRMCILIFPDSWDKNLYTVNNPNEPKGSTDKNKISDDDWNDILEPAGVLMLPVTRNYRTDKTLKTYDATVSWNLGEVYWTSTLALESEDNKRAKALWFDDVKITEQYRSRGLRVRLVQPVVE